MRGLVVKNTGSWYSVRTTEGETIECKIKGHFRLQGIRSTNPVVIGDWVEIEPNREGTNYIIAINERKNYLIRRASNLSKQSHILAANVDLLLLIVTVNHPPTTTVFIDRILATSEAYRIPAHLAFNKTDCYDEEEQEYLDALIHLYSTIGYPCSKFSALQGDHLEEIQQLIRGKVTLLTGHSGVGKSTLINRLVPGSAIKTKDISSYLNRGMHTTTFSEMIALPDGGYLIDTPGIKGFGTLEMEDAEIAHYFPELFRFSADCRFHNCTHRHEPGCAVLEALSNHHISESRYKSYLSILEDKEENRYREAH